MSSLHGCVCACTWVRVQERTNDGERFQLELLDCIVSNIVLALCSASVFKKHKRLALGGCVCVKIRCYILHVRAGQHTHM